MLTTPDMVVILSAFTSGLSKILVPISPVVALRIVNRKFLPSCEFTVLEVILLNLNQSFVFTFTLDKSSFLLKAIPHKEDRKAKEKKRHDKTNNLE